MGRYRRSTRLRVLLNNQEMGQLEKTANGALQFCYSESWLNNPNAIPVSLALPLRDGRFQGPVVQAVFENLLPDIDILRARIASQVEAAGSDAFNLLAAIGRDCVGALQFVKEDDAPPEVGTIDARPIEKTDIEAMVNQLGAAPLGLVRDDGFRISVAGAQEKTALLWHKKRWHKPLGTTPATHILKPSIGQLPNGIDLSESIENEYYCLRLLALAGLPTAKAHIEQFGETPALVVERFDRLLTSDKRLLRRPQEDCCQALATPPVLKYQNDGGPNLNDLLQLLAGSDDPEHDRKMLMQAQIMFWLIGATDGHAKNFSIFLGPGGSFQLTPLYDVLSAQPSVKKRQIEKKALKLAMSVGHRNHYRIEKIQPRHFVQSGAEAGMAPSWVEEILEQAALLASSAVNRIESELPQDFPAHIHESISKAVLKRVRLINQMRD